MNNWTIIAYAVVVVAILTAATGIPVQRQLKRKRAIKFAAICKDWLRDINLAAINPAGDTSGQLYYSSDAICERSSGGGWLVRYPLIKRFPDLGITASRIDLIVFVYSLNPNPDGTIDTVFIDLIEATPRWWSNKSRISTLPKLVALVNTRLGRERKFAYTSILSDTLVPAR